MAYDMVWRAARASLGQPINLGMQLRITLDPDGIIPSLCFKLIKQCW